MVRFTRAALLAATSILGLACSEAPLDTAPGVDLDRFQGQWFEIAKLPRPTEVDCRATTASYKRTGSTTLDLIHECHVGSLDGPVRQSVAHAKVPDGSSPAKLSVDFGSGYWGDYWIIDVGKSYEYAVVGHPTRKYLWIISRTAKLDQATLDGILQRAKDQGFETANLEYTQQAP